MMKQIELDYELERPLTENEWTYTELRVVAEIEEYIPAKITGPPENCYPEQGGNAYIIEIFEGDQVWSGELTCEEEEDILDKIYEKELEQ